MKSKESGHVEVCEVFFERDKVSLLDILQVRVAGAFAAGARTPLPPHADFAGPELAKIFFQMHDPTDLGGQVRRLPARLAPRRSLRAPASH